MLPNNSGHLCLQICLVRNKTYVIIQLSSHPLEELPFSRTAHGLPASFLRQEHGTPTCAWRAGSGLQMPRKLLPHWGERESLIEGLGFRIAHSKCMCATWAMSERKKNSIILQMKLQDSRSESQGRHRQSRTTTLLFCWLSFWHRQIIKNIFTHSHRSHRRQKKGLTFSAS